MHPGYGYSRFGDHILDEHCNVAPCEHARHGLICTRPYDHTGDHEAGVCVEGGKQLVVGAWPNDKDHQPQPGPVQWDEWHGVPVEPESIQRWGEESFKDLLEVGDDESKVDGPYTFHMSGDSLVVGFRYGKDDYEKIELFDCKVRRTATYYVKDNEWFVAMRKRLENGEE